MEKTVILDGSICVTETAKAIPPKHNFKWGDDYHYATFFRHDVLNQLLDTLIVERGMEPQAAFDYISESRTCETKSTREAWSGNYLYKGIAYAGFIESVVNSF